MFKTALAFLFNLSQAIYDVSIVISSNRDFMLMMNH